LSFFRLESEISYSKNSYKSIVGTLPPALRM
jgi:hypothetical protein